MPKVHANSDELRGFAGQLEKFNQDLNSMKSHIESRFNGLDWNDPAYRKFEGQFKQTMAVLKRFIDDSPQHVRLLKKKADELDQFLHG